MPNVVRIRVFSRVAMLICLTVGAELGGSAGLLAQAQDSEVTIVINELMASNQTSVRDNMDDYDDWIELYNYGEAPLDVGGMWLTDDPSAPTEWQIPDGDPQRTTLAPGGYLVLWADNEPHEGVLHAAFRLGIDGEQIGLYDRQQRPVDVVSYGTQRADTSYGRLPDAGADWRFLGSPTPGRPNKAAPTNVIITEIMYHPHQQGRAENKALEYIELLNAGTAPVDLAGWRLSDGVAFTFPEVELGVAAYMVVAADVNEFALAYPEVKNVVGGWNGSLSNSGERIELADDSGTVIDWVRYADEGDWAVRELAAQDRGHRGWVWSDAHDGAGQSLELINPAMPNEHGQNWAASDAAGGSPGHGNSAAGDNVAPFILDVAHFPVVPGPNDIVTVTARVMDEVATNIAVRLYYRVDASTQDDWGTPPLEDVASYRTVPMFDDGAHGDERAGDGIHAGQIPAHPNGAILEFFVEAEDIGGRSRTWPARSVVDDVSGQLANALVLVDASFDPYWVAGSQPLYYLIMRERERAELAYIGSFDPDSRSRAQMNGTFISVTGRGATVRYCVGIRNRGAGSRINRNGSYRNNYRVNFRHDGPWNDVTALNINNRYSYLQLLGSAVWRMADLPATVATAIQLRVNGEDLALTNNRMYGSYVALEVIDDEFAHRHFPDDPSGNAYRCTNDTADLSYRGTDPARYRSGYEKQTNEAADDYADLLHLTDVLNNTPGDDYVVAVSEVVNLGQWLRFLAVDALAGNLEGGLTTPKGDDYAMYRGVRDPRFWLIPHDLDTLFGQGDHSPDINRDIHVYASLNGLEELLNHPEIVAMYHEQCVDLIETVFAPERFDPLADQMLGGWVPEQTIDSIKQYVRQRSAGVLAQIPRELSVSSDLPIVDGYHHTTVGGAPLYGNADAVRTRSVVVGGQPAAWLPMDGEWVSGGVLGASETLIASGAVWKYLDDGSDQGDMWRNVVFDDAGWLEGRTQLGYGDGDEATVVSYGPDAGAKYITTYFRHAFNVTDVSEYLGLRLRLLRDDGAVVYLNGAEVARSNMPDDPTDYGTEAGANVGGADEDMFVEFVVDPHLLAQGMNVMATEVHQGSPGSSDMSFDLTLDAMRAPDVQDNLRPGINRIPVKTFDGPDGAGKVLERGHIDLWYDTGLTNDYPKWSAADSDVAGAQEMELNLVVRDSYLPGVPVLVRLELLDGAGAVRRDIWDAVAVLAVDAPGVQLSPDRVSLYNGRGSALVTFTGPGDLTLIADLDGVQAAAPLIDWGSVPVHAVSDSLHGSATWNGVYHVTGGDFMIPDGVTLTLEPGTMVLIDGVPSGTDGTDIQIEGSIQALGTATSPVTFTAAVAGANWGELRFAGAEPSTFTYTNITQAGHSPRVGHSNSGPAIRAQGSQIVFDHAGLTDHAGKTMHTTSGCDLAFRHCLLARSIMGPEIAATALLFEDCWITEMHARDDADAIYIHGQQAGQRCILSRGVIADTHDDGIDTLGSQIAVQDYIIRNCRDKGVSVYGGETTLDRCLIVENNVSPEDPTIATVAAKAFEGSTATVNIAHTTIVTWKTPGYTDIGIQSHNKYGVNSGTIVYNVTDSIIDATDPVDTQEPYVDADIHIDRSTVVGEPWPGTGNLDADPFFVDVLSHDYRLSASSPCLGAGADGQDQGYYQSAGQVAERGELTADTIWIAEEGPYRITSELVIPAGVSLTIAPGTSVFFEPDSRMLIHGRLVAEGTEQAMIRFTRTPGSGGTWDGLQFAGSLADNRLVYAVVEYGRTDDGMIGVEDSRLRIENVTLDHTDLRRIRTIDSSLVVRNCTFTDIFEPNEPPTTDNRSEHIWGRGVPKDGQVLIEGNVFGRTKGHNDAIDLDGPSRPDPILQIVNNLFMGGGDDALDLEADAHIEGNTFLHYFKDRYNTAPRESNALSAGSGKHYVLVRNVFYDVGHVAQIKDRAFMTFVSNTVVSAKDSAFYFMIPGQTRSPGRGIYVDSCIFHNVATPFADFIIDDPEWGTTEIEVSRSIISGPWQTLGEGNMDVDPLFVAPGSDFRLKGISPAIGAGRNGLDMGADVPAGASVFGEPAEITWRTDALLTADGPGIVSYRYSLNDPSGPWSEEQPVDVPIQLAGLGDGRSHTLYVLGRNSAGIWQAVPNASRTWYVDASYRRLVINELLASNVAAVEYGGTYPDLIELSYDGPHAIDLAGMSITNEAARPHKFVFPQGTVMQPGAYLVLLAETATGGTGLHLGFALDGKGGSVLLYDSTGALVDSVTYGLQLADLSVGRASADGPWALTVPTFGQANVTYPLADPAAVTINEWLAQGEVLFVDDFIELFNPQPLPADLGGCYLTDNPTTQADAHPVPPLTFVPGEGFAVFTAAGRNLPGHLGWKLSADGEIVALLDIEQRQVDKVLCGPQTIDISQGRSPDGSSTLELFALPTPGVCNPFNTTTGVEENLVAVDSTWSYEQSDQPPDASWYEPAYADSSWPRGQGVLYVEGSGLPGPKNTPLALGPMTFYFRTHFLLDVDPAALTALELTTLIDDGAVVYVNGVEVLRLRMPAGPIGHDTRADRSVGNAVYEGPFAIPADLLVQGDNVIAVEVHQTSSGSSDIVFALSLDASFAVASTGDPLAYAYALLDGLRITELMYHAAEGDSGDYIELRNVADVTLDLAGVRVAGGVDFVFGPTTLAPGDYVVVAGDLAAFRSRYGQEVRVAGQYASQLSNAGEEIVLTLPRPLEAAILRFRYDDAWYPGTDGGGESLKIADPTVPPILLNDAASWYASTPSPGGP